MHRLNGLLVMLFVLALTATAWAESDIPDLKGTWIMKASAMAHAKPSKAPPSKRLNKKLGSFESEMVMVITNQEGFQFSGYMESKHDKLTLSGIIGFDNKSIYIVGENGVNLARLVAPDKMEAIYIAVTPDHSIAAREIFTRKH